MSKKVLGSIIIVLAISIGMFSYSNNNGSYIDELNLDNMNIEILDDNEKSYYTLVSKADYQGANNLKDLELVTYDKSNKQKRIYDLGIDEPINGSSIKSINDWILISSINNDKLIGINSQNGNVETLVDNAYNLKNFSIHNNILVYEQLGEDTKLYIKAVDINTKESIELECLELKDYESDINYYMDISVYDQKIAYNLDDKIKIYDFITKETRILDKFEYYKSVSIYKDKIYTYRNNGVAYDLVEITLDGKEKVILKNTVALDNICIDNDRLIYNNNFYDLKEEKLYVGKAMSRRVDLDIIVDDYILMNNKYEAMKLGENYYDYPLDGELGTAYSKILDKDLNIQVLIGGEIAIYDRKTFEVLKNHEGFTRMSMAKSMDFAFEDNIVYGVEMVDVDNRALVSINIETNERRLIKNLGKVEGYISYMDINNNELMYVIKNEEFDEVVVYNLNDDTEKSHQIADDSNIRFMCIFDKYLVRNTWQPGVVELYDRKTGEFIRKSAKDNYELIGASKDGIVVRSYEGRYYLLDSELNEIKELKNYNKVVDQLLDK
ncbi:MAG: hypothetical protein RR620_02815 [Clostridium sp.]